jgi:hypothetical protein
LTSFPEVHFDRDQDQGRKGSESEEAALNVTQRHRDLRSAYAIKRAT